MKQFNQNNKRLCSQFENIEWITDSGVSAEELKNRLDAITQNPEGLPKNLIKAKSFDTETTFC